MSVPYTKPCPECEGRDAGDGRRELMEQATSSPAYDAAIAEGCPDTLFRGLCDWIEQPGHVVDSNDVAIRYSPNTRAIALKFWRVLNTLREGSSS